MNAAISRSLRRFTGALMSGCSGGMKNIGIFEVNRRKKSSPASRSFTTVS